MTTANDTSRDGELRFALLASFLFVLATLPRLFTHELWRDEAWLWLVALDSHSLSDLFGPLARSGQGYLFPVLCFVARQFSESPRAMQLVHLAVAGGAAFVLARWAPFSRLERVLLLCGYLTFYEYAVISRHYAVGMLLLWLACVFAKNRPSAIGVGIALGLACQTTVYAFIVAVAVVCGWALDRRLRRDELEPLPRRDVAIGAALGVAGAIAGLIQLMPSEGTSFAPGWRFHWDPQHALKVLRMPWRAFVPLSRLEVGSWNTNILDPWLNVESAAGVAMLLLALAMLRRRPVALATFAIGASGLLAFAYTKLVGEMRHGGHLWLLFIAAIWLSGGLEAADRKSWRSRALLLLLAIQIAAALFSSGNDLLHPFTNAPATAELIRSEGLDRFPLLGHREPPSAPIALALGKPLFAPSRGIYAKYPDYGPKQREMGDGELRCVARALARREKSDIGLVINRELPVWGELDAAGAVTGSICRSEDYHLYRLRLERLDATDADAKCDESAR
jgi:hypothetical protein